MSSTIFLHNLAKFHDCSSYTAKLVLKNVFLRYRDFKIFGPFLAKNDLFSFNISENPLGIPVFVIFYGLVCGST